jgi:hypothetical protein
MVMGSGALLCQTEEREPQMNADERRLNEITEKIIGCADDAANGLGSGFLRQTHHTKSLINLRSSAFISGSIFFPVDAILRTAFMLLGCGRNLLHALRGE